MGVCELRKVGVASKQFFFRVWYMVHDDEINFYEAKAHRDYLIIQGKEDVCECGSKS